MNSRMFGEYEMVRQFCGIVRVGVIHYFRQEFFVPGVSELAGVSVVDDKERAELS